MYGEVTIFELDLNDYWKFEKIRSLAKDYTIRAKIGERLTEFGEKQNDQKLQLKGLKESFYSNPGLEYLIDLYIKASELNCFDIIKDECEQRLKIKKLIISNTL